jgi:hypothetical protein
VTRGREYFLGEHADWLATAGPGRAAAGLAGRGAA